MTALIYIIDPPKQVFLAMDTLCRTTTDTGELVPHNFCTKMVPLPHLHAVICGTGDRSLVFRWAAFVQSSVVAQDIQVLNTFAPQQLRALAGDSPADNAQATTTVYHFGASKDRGSFCGFRFRSTSGFEPEPLQADGLAYKPDTGVEVADLVSTLELPRDFVEIMRRQKRASAEPVSSELVAVGGEVQFCHITHDGIWLTTAHRFDDYDANYQLMLARLDSEPT